MKEKKYVHDNYVYRKMCGDYCLNNRHTKFNKYIMHTPEDFFDVIGHSRIFSTLDLCQGYHQLPIRDEEKIKTTFLNVNVQDKDCLYQWQFLSFGLKNVHVELQRIMSKCLVELDFISCYIDDIMEFRDKV